MFRVFSQKKGYLIVNNFNPTSLEKLNPIHELRVLTKNFNLQETGHFPRITHCDFQRRKPGSVQWDTVLCVLTLNIYYEKILLFLWFWMLAVSMISTAHFFYWMVQCCFSNAYVIKLLRSFLLIHSKTTYVDKFFKIIGRDGMFILHQIALNIGDLPASYLALAMLNIVEDLEKHGEDASLIIEKGPKSVWFVFLIIFFLRFLSHCHNFYSASKTTQILKINVLLYVFCK